MNVLRISIIAAAFMGLLTSNAAAQDTVRRLTQGEAMKAAVTKPQPEYPPIAKQLRLEGKVEVEVSIDPSGNVDNVRVVTGNAALTSAAVNATKRWKFEPIVADGKPVRAVAILNFTFKL